MRHLLVIRLSALGDVALMAPLVRHYAEANPDVHFTVAGPPLLQPLFEGRGNVAYLGLRKRQSFLKIYQALNNVGADAVADLHKVNRVGFALAVLRLRHVLNPRFRIVHLRKGRLSRWLFVHHHWRRRPRRAQYLRYDDVFRRLRLRQPAADTSAAPTRLLPAVPRTVGLAPFSQHRGKVWPLERVAQVAAMLAERGYSLKLFGSKEEAALLDTVATHPGIENLAGRHAFADELKVIGGLALMVSMDSANMHFASALGVPVVSIWGATHPDFGFYGYGQPRANALCADLPCQPCSAYGAKPCRHGDYRCLLAISPQMVVEKIEEVLLRGSERE